MKTFKFVKKEYYNAVLAVLFMLAFIAIWKVFSYFPEPNGLITSIMYGLGGITVTTSIAFVSAKRAMTIIIAVLKEFKIIVNFY